MNKILIILFFLPICVSAQRYKEQMNFNSVGDQEMALGRYRIGNVIRIECQISGGWAEDGGIYHIAADWNYLPKVIYRGESSITNRLRFYGYIDPNSKGYAFLFATWDNVSPSERYGNDIKITIYSEGNFDVNNKGSFTKSIELENVLIVQSNTGRVGIGTNTPLAKLDVNGNIKTSRLYLSNYMDQIRFEVPGEKRYFLMSKTINEDKALALYSPEDGGWLFEVKEQSGNFIINRGNLGVGTTTPDYKLDVLGTIRAKEVKVATDWSDFVFEPDYDLLSLDQVEEFISENGHLPDIPSTEAVKENGIELGQMNALLLMKIEELTLHLIELKKEVEILKESK